MPNHVQNVLVIEGHEMHLRPMLEKIKSDKGAIDFNKIIPMPKELKGTTSPSRIITQAEYNKREYQKNFQADKDHQISIGKAITKKMQSDYIQRFGHDNWYDWAIQNWGTKWGAYDTSITDTTDSGKNRKQVTVYFQTAWSSGANVIQHLADQFPTLDFYLSYADEDCGSNTGQFWFDGGQLKKNNLPDTGSNEAMELYFSCWNDSKEGWEMVNGKWEYTMEW